MLLELSLVVCVGVCMGRSEGEGFPNRVLDMQGLREHERSKFFSKTAGLP